MKLSDWSEIKKMKDSLDTRVLRLDLKFIFAEENPNILHVVLQTLQIVLFLLMVYSSQIVMVILLV
jgi:hypothetical protein